MADRTSSSLTVTACPQTAPPLARHQPQPPRGVARRSCRRERGAAAAGVGARGVGRGARLCWQGGLDARSEPRVRLDLLELRTADKVSLPAPGRGCIRIGRRWRRGSVFLLPPRVMDLPSSAARGAARGAGGVPRGAWRGPCRARG